MGVRANLLFSGKHGAQSALWKLFVRGNVFEHLPSTPKTDPAFGWFRSSATNSEVASSHELLLRIIGKGGP